ncbi:MAG: HEPN domain-containing protein [Pseudomonadota bacterium]
MAKQELDKLSASYFKTFQVRVEVLPEYFKRKSYSDVIRESQEALELFLKALLRTMGWSPSFSHDPGKELAELKKNIPAEFREVADPLVDWSRKLRRERELSYYGAADFIPSEEYSEKEAREALQFLEDVSVRLKKFLG